jgi:hypothetical protein
MTRPMDDGGACTQVEIFRRLLNFLNRLDAAHVHYTLGHTRPESVMADISLPGWRWPLDGTAPGAGIGRRTTSCLSGKSAGSRAQLTYSGRDWPTWR